MVVEERRKVRRADIRVAQPVGDAVAGTTGDGVGKGVGYGGHV